MMQQIRQILEWAICNAPTCKLGSDLRYWYWSEKLDGQKHRYCFPERYFWTGSGFSIESPSSVYIGEGCSFGENVLLLASGSNNATDPNYGSGIIIGKNVELHRNVVVLTGNHNWEDIKFDDHIKSCVWIEEGVTVLSNAVILPGVHLGKNCLIGAGSVVSRSIPEATIAVGNPARVIKKRYSRDIDTMGM